MSATTTLPGISLSRAAFVRLLDAVLNPNPDDPGRPRHPWGPFDPIGPVSGAFRDFWSVALNPQPLSPIVGPIPDPWGWSRMTPNPQPLSPGGGPGPQPWRAAFEARTVVDQAVSVYRMGETVGGDQAERAFEAARGHVRDWADWICGNVPRRFPRPWPWPLESDFEVDPVALLFAGALFQKAADAGADNPLQADFSAAADQLFETGMRQLG